MFPSTATGKISFYSQILQRYCAARSNTGVSLEQYRLLHNDQRHINSIKPAAPLKLLFEDANPAQDHKKDNPDRDGDKQSGQ